MLLWFYKPRGRRLHDKPRQRRRFLYSNEKGLHRPTSLSISEWRPEDGRRLSCQPGPFAAPCGSVAQMFCSRMHYTLADSSSQLVDKVGYSGSSAA
jgi:hypothetical protein